MQKLNSRRRMKNTKRAVINDRINNDGLKNKNLMTQKLADDETKPRELPDDIIRQIFLGFSTGNLHRYKCASKPWQSMISDLRFQQDYRAYRGLNSGLLICMKNREGHDFCYSPLQFWKRDVKNFHCPFWFPSEQITQVVRGLVRCYNHDIDAQVLDVHTGRFMELPRNEYRETYFFGYDPVEGVHKVIGFRLANSNKLCGRSKCQILTIGRDSEWRKLPDVPASIYGNLDRSTSLNNGFIYWKCWVKSESSLLSFVPNKEMFCFIKLPQGFQLPLYGRKLGFLEFRGRLALVVIDQHAYDLKLHILEDEEGNWWTTKHAASFPSGLSSTAGWSGNAIPVGILPNGHLLLAKLGYASSDLRSLEPVYSYDLQNDMFERLVAGELPLASNLFTSNEFS